MFIGAHYIFFCKYNSKPGSRRVSGIEKLRLASTSGQLRLKRALHERGIYDFELEPAPSSWRPNERFHDAIIHYKGERLSEDDLRRFGASSKHFAGFSRPTSSVPMEVKDELEQKYGRYAMSGCW
ncbi:hypothetical protein ACFLQN_04345 [Candidatus Aenigmatarchaeota archaeon]